MFVKKPIVRLAFIILIAGIFSAVAVLAAPGINKQLSYQGTLKTSGGVNVTDGDYDIVFKIYDAATGGNLLWTGTHTASNGNVVTVTNGIFNVLLGSGTGNTLTIDFNTDTLYLGITVSTDSEMTPRQRIGAAAYAFNADTLDGTGFATTTFTTGDVLYYDGSAFQRLGIGTNGQVLKLSSGLPLWSADIQGPSQANIFATTTDDLVIYPVDTSDVLVIGSNATTTTGNIFEVVGSSLFGGNGIFTGLLTAYNTISAPLFNATSTTATSTFTNLSVSANSELGTVISGTWQGSTIGEIYGGTGQSSYVIGDLLYANGANSLARLATSTAGSVLQLDLATGLPSYVATSTLNIALGDTNGTLAVNRGGTGSTTPSQFLFGDGAGGLTSTSTIAQNFIDSALARTSNVLTLTNWFATTSAFHLLTLEGVTSLIATNATTTNATSTNMAVSGAASLANTTNSGTLSVTGATTLANASSTNQDLSGYLVVTGDTTLSNASTTNVTASGYLTVDGNTTLANATSTNLFSTTLGINSEYFTDLTGVGLTLTSGALTVATSTFNLDPSSVDLAQGFTLVGDPSGNASATSTLFISSAGNVGIGTTSPSAQLALSNLLYVGGTGTSTIENNLAVLGALQVGNSSLYLDNNSIENLSGALVFEGASGGQVAIGTTTAASTLHVDSASASTSPILTLANIESIFRFFGTNATPEGAITGNTGDLAVDATGGKLYIKGDSGDNTGWTDVAAGTLAVQHINATTTGVVNTKYYASTTAATLTVTLPTSAVDGDRVQIVDAAGNFASNNLFVLPGSGDTIEGSTSTTTLSTSNTVTTFIYDKEALRWTIQGDNEEASTVLHYISMNSISDSNRSTGENILLGSSDINTSLGISLDDANDEIDIAQAGLYQIIASANFKSNAFDVTVILNLRNNGSNIAQGEAGISENAADDNTDSVTISHIVELSANDTLDFTISVSSDSVTLDAYNITVRQFPSAVITAQAQASEYILITPVDGDSMSGTGDDLDLGTVQKSSGISADMTANTISLKAGKTYELIAELRPFSISGTLEYGWVDSSNTELIASVGRGYAEESTNASSNAGARIIYTPTVDTDVKVRSVNGTGSFSVESRISRIEVRVVADGTKVAQFTGATASAAGTTGFIPKPVAGQQSALLLGDGSWLATTSLQFDTTIGSLNVGLGTSVTSALSNALFTVGSTTASQILFVGQDGKVGIGTTSPTALLGLQGAIGVNSTQLYLAADGKVGIGTTSPARSLHISSNSFAEIQLTSDAETTARDWHISVDETNGKFSIVETDIAERLTILEGGNVGIGTTTPGAALNVIGALCVDDTTPTCGDASRTDGTIYAVATTISGIDLAEQYPTKDDTLIAGELIALDPLNPVFVKRAQGEGNEQVIGIVSTAPGVLLGGFGSEQFVDEVKVAVALSGRAPVNVTTENGDIAIGDRVTISSVAGVGMKATAAHRSVGYALEPYSGDGVGKIRVFVQLEPGIIVSDAPFEGTVVVQDYTFEGNIIVRGHATFNEDTVGQAKILAGDTSVRVNFSEEYQYQPIVTITPRENWSGNYWVSDEITTGFTINVDPSQGVDVTFNWHAFSTDAPKIHVSDGTTLELADLQANPTYNAAGSGVSTDGVSADTEAPVMDSTSSPQVTINGNNPAEITVGATYSDNGITIEDDVDQNLGYSISLDGVEVTQIQIDTSEPGTHTIIYSVTDNDGNTTTATREVIVGGGDQDSQEGPEVLVESEADSAAQDEDTNLEIEHPSEELVVEEPVTEEPVAEESTTDEPTIEEPITEESIIEEPTVEEPIVEEPAADTNLAPQPTNE